MRKLNEQIIAHVGTNLNNVNFSEECLKECVENINTENLPISLEYDRNNVIGIMTNFKYSQGKIIADIILFDDIHPIDMFNKVIRCSYEVLNKIEKNPINIKKCIIRDGSVIDKDADAERELKDK